MPRRHATGLDLVALHLDEFADHGQSADFGPLGHLAVAAAQVADLLVDERLVNAHLVVDELGEPAEFDVHLRAEADVIPEGEDIRLVPVAFGIVLLGGNGLAQDAQLLLSDVAVHLLAQQLIQLVGEDGLAVLRTNWIGTLPARAGAS